MFLNHPDDPKKLREGVNVAFSPVPYVLFEVKQTGLGVRVTEQMMDINTLKTYATARVYVDSEDAARSILPEGAEPCPDVPHHYRWQPAAHPRVVEAVGAAVPWMKDEE